MKQNYLRKMMEWSIEIERGWNWRPGPFGRGLTKALDPATSRELAATYTDGEMEALWENLARTAALFRKVAVKVADSLGFSYPYDLDKRITIYHQTVRGLDRQTTCKAEMARLLNENLSKGSG